MTGGAGFIGSNLVMELQRRWPWARLTVVDDFRSGTFKNLAGYKGDVAAVSAANYRPTEKFDCVFHLASITDTTVGDQRLMIHDNVEGFRNILGFARKQKARVVYASSAATYGIASVRMSEDSEAAPANAYAFSKMILDNVADEERKEGMRIDGLRFFNVYGPGEGHKGASASMIFQLAVQMRQQRRPRIFRNGEQRRDFVHIDDVVDALILASERGKNAVYNVGSGRGRSFNAVVRSLNAALGTSFEPDYFDNPYDFYQTFTEADLTRSKRDLGYVPKFDLEPGVLDYMKRLGWAKS
ncbi:MAG TPA: ADP-glyceromanno-heptose 6-epimerase [Planctomycetota bacterium]|nr:ADP-glyceromanno-heptose 6-epimerase [Planctomycetota bacterium]